ncbi:MAG: HAMP domain-containing protein, partial [Deltaproteobacteria bacterium]|nr:HAMP domain-containing protein [Deltaproteobacteria bacterium]
MRLKTQFIITIFLFGLVLVVMATSAIITNHQVKKTGQQERMASHIAQGANELSYLANDYLIYRESQQLKRWQSRFAAFTAQVAALRTDRPEQQALVANLRANQNRFKEVFDSAAAALENPSRDLPSSLAPAFFQTSWSRLAVQSQGLVADASRLSQLLRQEMDRLTETRTRLMYGIVGLFGLFLLVSYRLTYRRILKSIGTLRSGTAVVGSGNLDFIIAEQGHDEIGELSQSFNRMTADLKKITASKADLEKEITERQRAEEELRESETKYRNLFENMAEEVHFWRLVRDEAGRIKTWRLVDANPPTLQTWGRTSLDEIQGKTTDEIFGPGSTDHYLPVVEKIMTEGLPYAFEDYFPNLDRYFRFTSVPLGDYFITTGADITGIKKAEEALKRAHDELEVRVQERTAELARSNMELTIEIAERQRTEQALQESKEQLRSLAFQILSAQEEERKRIALEVHDVLGSSLSAIKFKAEETLHHLPKDGPANIFKPLETLVALIQDMIGEARRIQADLRPPLLDDLGIVATLSWFCRRFGTIYSGIKCEPAVTLREEAIPDQLKIALFRITQEAMNNIGKHALADSVLLDLRKVDGA